MADRRLVQDDDLDEVFADEENEPPCWWVDFCVDDCPETQCHEAGRCAFPPRDIVDVPIAGDVL